MFYIGIDPGLHGAVGMLDFTREHAPHFLRVADLPIETKSKATGSVRADAFRTVELIDEYLQNCKCSCRIFIEEPYVMEDAKAHGGLKLGDCFGVIRGAVAAAMSLRSNVDVIIVPPSKWKKALRLTKNKEECRARAVQLFPDARPFLSAKKYDGRAEALLLAYYGGTVHRW
jgi:crossover junction endodeoxyribonuclease RuvC